MSSGIEQVQMVKLSLTGVSRVQIKALTCLIFMSLSFEYAYLS
jgi:hypothetical protein